MKHDKYYKKTIVFVYLFLISFNVIAENSFSDKKEVKIFIQKMSQKHHFSPVFLKNLLDQVKIRPAVIRKISHPYEAQPWYIYNRLFVTDWRVKAGTRFWAENQKTLERAEKKYRVPANIIVATIGIESKYGQKKGDFRVLDALVNLSFNYSPRAHFFKNELEQFLLLTREKKLDPLTIMGSYTGAIGQPQFMPSSYRRYAVDFSGQHHIDLSNNTADIIGSIANYYHQHGWHARERIVSPTTVTGHSALLLKKPHFSHLPFTNAQLHQQGIIVHPTVSTKTRVNLLKLEHVFSSEYWVTFHNFYVIMRYNMNPQYAMAIYQLSEKIKATREATTA